MRNESLVKTRRALADRQVGSAGFIESDLGEMGNLPAAAGIGPQQRGTPVRKRYRKVHLCE
ncbi:MAG TPA: hypothetical protein VME24_03375 [Alphaproteobacteria bacterium]|nr:hypothetical protein [Alphaproteobacteria bacterium]